MGGGGAATVRRVASAWALGGMLLLGSASTGLGQALPPPGTGDVPRFVFDEYPLSDRATLKVNPASGNVLLQEVDVDNSDTDFEYDVTRSHNSGELALRIGGDLPLRWTHDM